MPPSSTARGQHVCEYNKQVSLVDARALCGLDFLTIAYFLCHAHSQAHCSFPHDCGTGQCECVSWYWCERYRPWIRQSVCGSAEIKTGPPECSTHSVSLCIFSASPSVTYTYLFPIFIYLFFCLFPFFAWNALSVSTSVWIVHSIHGAWHLRFALPEHWKSSTDLSHHIL